MKSKLAIIFLLLACIPAFAQKKDDGPRNIRVEYRDTDEFSFQNIITQQSITDYVCIASPGNPPTGKVRTYCDSGTGQLTCLNSVGANVCPGGGSSAAGPLGTIQSTNGVGTLVTSGEADSGTVFSTTRDFQGKGPNPYTDVRAYGVRAVNQAVAPAIPGITCTISSTSCALSSASSFQNGDGVVVFGAGPANSITTPTGLAVTPSVSSAPTGTGFDVASVAGSTQYCYAILAEDKAGGLSAATSQVCTSTGQAALGYQTVSISGFTRSGQTVTATATAHGLSTGAWVNITTPNVNGTDNLYFGGWYNVTVTDANHFTYLTGNAVSSGAPTVSGAGGTLNYWYDNKLTWTSQANAYRYYVYAGPSGSLTLAGVSKVQSTVNGLTPDTTWQDYGSTMMSGQLFPYFVPSTPPVSAQADPLVTTVVSGAGTTTLTLANSASTSVSGATILFDNTPNIVTAASHCSFNSLLYFPGSTNSYVTNSYLNLSAYTLAISLAGSNLALNDTMEVSGGTKIFGTLGAQTNSSLSFGYPVGGSIQGLRANPAVYASNGINQITGVQFSAGNAAVAVLEDGASNDSMNYVNFDATAGPMSMPLMLRAGVFSNNFDHIALIANQGPGSSTPVFYLSSNAALTNLSLSGRGIFLLTGGSGTDITISGNTRIQGNVPPFLAIANLGAGNVGGNITISNVELDTASTAMVANLTTNGGSYGGKLSIFDSFAGPASGYGYLTGQPVGLAVGNAISGQNVNSYHDSNFGNNTLNVFGTGEVGYQMAIPTAAASVVVSSGGSVPVGNICYSLAAVDVNGNLTTLGPKSCVTTTTGNQTVTITTPAVPVNGAANYAIWRNGAFTTNASYNCANFDSFSGAGPGLTYVDTSANCGISAPTQNLALSQSITSAGINTTSFNILNNGFVESIVSAITANRTVTLPDFSGAIGVLGSGCNSSNFLGGDNICRGAGGGTVTYTANHTASTSDNGKLVLMNCSSACAYTLPAAQPSTGWFANIMTIGSTTATVALAGGDTFNGTATVPVLLNWQVFPIYANTATFTDYEGSAPLIAGTNVTFGAASNGMTITASASGSTGWPSITGAATNTNTGFVLAPSSTSSVPWTTNCPSGISVDCTDIELNAVKEVWVTSTGVLNTLQVPSFNGNAAMYSTEAAGGDFGGAYPNPTVTNLSNVTNNSLANTGLAHSSINIAGTAVALGGSTVSFPSPGAIGGTTPAAITGTTITANTSLSVNGGTALTGEQGTDTKILTAGTVSGTAATLCTDSNGGATTAGCSGGSGPGTGTANAVTDWATSSTLGSIVGQVTGQSLVAVNGSAPAFSSPGVQDGNGGAVVTSSGYTIQCDSSTALIDRVHILRFQSGASAPIVPLSTATGCTGGFAVTVIDDGAGSLVFGRTSPDTFSVFNGTSATDGATSFTLGNGQYATLTQGASGIWEVRITQTANLGTPTTLTLTNATGLPCAAMPALTGDATTSAGACATSVVKVNGAAVPASKTIVGTNSSSQIIDASSATLANNTTGTAANLSGTPALPSGTTATTQSAGDSSNDLATDSFVTTAVNNAVAGVNPAVAVLAATTGSNLTGTYNQVGGGIGDTFTITATGAFTLDGVAINTIGQRVLLKDQTTASQNGVYTATIVGTTGISAVFTRALDYDTPSDVNNTGSIPVQSGTVNATTSWLLTSQVTSIGSSGSSLTYTQFSLAPSNIVTASSNFANGAVVQAAGANKTLASATGHGIALPLQCSDSSGSGTAQSCTTSPSFTPVKGDAIIYYTTTANTGALTENVNSTSAAPVQKWDGTALASGDIKANTPVWEVFDGTNWQVQTIGNAPSGGGGVTSVTIAGTTNQITASGTCTITMTGTCTLSLPAAVTLGASGTAGTLAVFPASGNFTTTWGSAATASNTILGFATAPVTGDLISCTTSSTTCTLTDSGVLAANVLTTSSTIPINKVVSATGAIATIADGNNPLTINCALTSGTTCLTTGETTAATTAGAVEHQITTLTTTTAIALQITQGAAGPANANAPAVLNISAAAAGGAAGASNAGSIGAPITLLTGAGSAGGATTGVGGAGGAFTLTTGAGGAAGGTATNNGGAGGGFSVTTGAGGNGGSGAGTAGSGGGFTITLGAPGTNSATGTSGSVGQFNVTGNAPASTANATAGAAGTVFNITGIAGGASSNASGSGGTGSAVSINAGTGGAATGATSSSGGAGGAISLTAGNGGTSGGAGANSNGGNVVVTPGTPGTGGSGAAGKAGVLQVLGSNAGMLYLQQGAANTTSNTVIPANSIIDQAPTAVTAYAVTRPGVVAQGILTNTVTSAVDTQGFSGDANHSTTVSWSTATSVGSTVLCSSANCPVGTYRISAHIDVTTACTTTGSYLVNVIYTDDTTVSKTEFIPLNGVGTTFSTGVLVPISTTDFGQGTFILHSTGATSINYSTTASACGSGGPGVGKLYLTVEPIQ
jgi:hypothetical protein